MNIKENLPVVSIIYSFYIMASHRTPQIFDYCLGSFFYQECFRYLHDIKITEKVNVLLCTTQKGGKGQ